MVTIKDKYWGVHRANRSLSSRGPSNTNVTWKKDDLSYVTPMDNSKAFEKRKATGLKWSRYQDKDCPLTEEEMEFEFVNGYIEGFVVADFATRYSTSNKLIRLFDPRGFIVESSVENFINTIDNCTIHRGIVIGPCRWGKHGQSFILVPQGAPFDK